jgi:hypothetical protein
VFFALKKPSEEIKQKRELPFVGGVWRATDRYKAGSTFALDQLQWSSINLRSLRSAVFQLEPELSKDYDIWFRNK